MTKYVKKFGLALALLLSLGLKADTNSSPAEDNSQSSEPSQASQEIQIPELDSVLSPEEVAQINQNPEEQYVYISSDVIESIKAMPSTPEIDSLKEHVSSNYRIASYEVAKSAVDAVVKCYDENPNTEVASSVEVLKSYQKDLETGDACIITENQTRRNRCRTFCRLFVRDCLRTGSLLVQGDAGVTGNLDVTGNIRAGRVTASDFRFAQTDCDPSRITFRVPGNIEACGTISASNFPGSGTDVFGESISVDGTVTADNFVFAGGCDSTETFIAPDIVSCDNVRFNTNALGDAPNTLDALGGVEAKLKDIRGTIQFSNPAIELSLSGTPLTLTVALGTTGVDVIRGAGFSASSISTDPAANLNLAGVVAITAGASFNLEFRVNFANPYDTIPSVLVSLENGDDAPFILGDTLTPETVINNLLVSVNNVSTTGFDVSLVIAGASITGVGAIGSLVNDLLGDLQINFVAQGRAVSS